jgi:hypothetical protein
MMFLSIYHALYKRWQVFLSILLISGFLVVEANAAEQLCQPINKSTCVAVRMVDKEMSISIFSKKVGLTVQQISINSEKNISFRLEDYNFDNNKDISFSYYDEGQGIFLISQVFLYSAGRGKFVEAHPACDDQFLNLKINKKMKNLTSTYFKDNSPKICITRPEQLAIYCN